MYFGNGGLCSEKKNYSETENQTYTLYANELN